MSARAIGYVLVLALGFRERAGALTVQELVCQQSVGKESLRFLTRAQPAGVKRSVPAGARFERDP